MPFDHYHRLCSAFFGSFICSILVLSSQARAQGQPKVNSNLQEPSSSTTWLATQVEDSLTIKESGEDVLNLIAQAVAKKNSPSAEYAPALNNLVKGLLKGPSGHTLIDELLPLLEIGGKTDPYASPKWKYGRDTDRDAVAKTMWKLARESIEKNPQQANEFARASLVLASLADDEGGWMELLVVVDSSDEASKLMGLSDADFAVLKKVVTDRQDSDKTRKSECFYGALWMDYVNDPNRPVSVDSIKTVLLHFDKAFRQNSVPLVCKWSIINDTWSFLNLVRTRQSTEGQALVRKQLEAWNKDFPDENVTRWVTQALSREGPAPDLMTQKAEVSPEGRIVPVTPKK